MHTNGNYGLKSEQGGQQDQEKENNSDVPGHGSLC